MITAEPVYLTDSQKHTAFTLMRSRGGSFASALAEAWFRGDEVNRQKIEETWPGLLENYHYVAEALSQTGGQA